MTAGVSAAIAAPDDGALMARIAAGDEAAFRQFADRHVGRMLRLAQSILGSAAEADDVVQEALMRVWRHAARWDAARGQPGTWVHAIVTRLCVDQLRRRRHEPLDAAEHIADSAPTALDALSSRREALALRAALASLPARQRAALALFYREDMAGAEAAETLGIKLRAFWSLLERARRALRDRMQRVSDPRAE